MPYAFYKITDELWVGDEKGIKVRLKSGVEGQKKNRPARGGRFHMTLLNVVS
jgi:hypothetical protein